MNSSSAADRSWTTVQVRSGAADLSRVDRWSKGYLLVVGVLATAWALAPTGVARDVAYESIGLVAVVTVVVGTRLRTPRFPAAWLLLAAGVLLLVVGDGLYSWYQDVQGVNAFPSPADAVYLSAYPLLVGGLALLVRARRAGRDAAGWLDAAVVTVSLGLIAWVTIGAPIVAEQGLTPTTLISMAYPAADVVLLGVLAHVSMSPGERPAAYRLLLWAVVALLVADILYTVLGAAAADADRWLDATWLASYVLAGGAALHPTMRRLSEPADRGMQVTPRRLAGLTVAVLVAPGIQLVERLTGSPYDSWPVLVGSGLLIALVLTRLQISVHDAQTAVRQRTQLQERLAHQAAYDSLTGATSRAHTLEAIEAALLVASRTGRAVGLMYVDLDHFKQVNDTFGHAVGDEVLQVVVDRIRHVVRPGDLVGRMGGDEIVVLVEDAPAQRALLDVAMRIVEAIERQVRVGDHSLWLSASVGLALSHPGLLDADELVRDADAAAYRAKSEGRARVQVFGEELRKELSERADVEAAIRHGLAAGEFVMHYQPLLELSSGRVAGYEALARWERPGHGLVPPSGFIPLAEQSSLICDIGHWALQEATAQVAAWDRDGRPQTQMSVNVSGRHLASAVIVDDVVEACVAAGVAPERLVLEVTETVPLDTPVMRTQLAALRRLGVGIHIDDFGTGYTSIGQLRNLPASALKIDRSLIALDDAGARELVALAVHAAHTAGLLVVAEGVETADQLAALREMGCDLVQGFHIARPAPAARVAAALDTRYRPAAEPALSDPSRTTSV